MLSIFTNIPFLIFIGAIIFNWLSTLLGASLVYVTNKENKNLVSIALGSSAGIMIAASFFSLILPAMNMLEQLSKWYLLIIPFGFFCGVLFLTLCDHFLPHEHMLSHEREGVHSKLSQNQLLMLAMTLHNIPEGLAVGVAFASVQHDIIPALILSIGIGIQNFPEGAIISMPLKSSGLSKNKSFIYGMLSGIVEPIGAAITILMSSFVVPILPYLLSFAAGAMVYVVIEELIPESSQGHHSNIATIGFAIGFVVMMILDVVLG